MPVIPFEEKKPRIAENVFIAPSGWVIGDVKLGKKSSVFFGAVLRGDLEPIIIGEETNIQDNAILHTTNEMSTCVVGNRVTIGHGAILHGCKVNDLCIIGMGSTILDNAVIGEGSIIGANSLVTIEKDIPPGVLAMGSPARIIRDLTEEEKKNLAETAARYCDKSESYIQLFKNY